MKHLFIINPAAGSTDRSGVYRRTITEICEKKGLSYEIRVSQAPGQCREIAHDAALTGEEYRIYACGGDGTLNEVVSGCAGFSNVAVTMFAGGSGNDFIRIFNETEPFRDLERLLDAQEAQFSLIKCNDSYCLNICSVGFDARIGTDVANYKRLPFLSGFRAYAVSAIINTIRGIAEHYQVEIDGQKFDGDQTLICACNGRYYGGGFNPVPEADPSDDLLEVLLVDKVSRFSVVTIINQYKNGKYADYPEKIHHFSARHIHIKCDKPSPINLDGELLVADEVDITLSPHRVRFFYPKGLTWQVPAKAVSAT